MTPQSRPARHSLVGGVLRGLAAAALALGLALAVPAVASALPPDGPGPETPGTKSKVWPSKVKVGDRLNFEVWGYPANETVYIKIDDGNMCKDTSHGACVYHTQKLDKKGHAKGSLIVPNLKVGKHWLRMLATGDVFDSKTGEKIGYKGYTRRGGNDFKVVAGGTTDQQVGDAPGGGSTNADGTIAGGEVAISVDEESPSPSATPTTEDPVVPAESTSPAAEPSSTAPTSSQEESPAPAAVPEPAAAERLPVVGIGVLAGAVLVGGGGIGWALVRRNRLAKAAAAAE